MNCKLELIPIREFVLGQFLNHQMTIDQLSHIIFQDTFLSLEEYKKELIGPPGLNFQYYVEAQAKVEDFTEVVRVFNRLSSFIENKQYSFEEIQAVLFTKKHLTKP